MIGLIANDSINNFDDIGNDNYDYTTQALVIGFYKLTLYSIAKNRLRFSVVLHESVSSEAVSQSIKH